MSLIVWDANAASGAVSRPNFGRSAGMPPGSADRRQKELSSKRIEIKKKQYPELFAPKRVLGPALTTYPPAKSDCGQTILRDRIVTTAVIVTDDLVAKYDVLTATEKSGSVAGNTEEAEVGAVPCSCATCVLCCAHKDCYRVLWNYFPSFLLLVVLPMLRPLTPCPALPCPAAHLPTGPRGYDPAAHGPDTQEARERARSVCKASLGV